MIRVLIWNEYRHEKCQPEVAKIYPQGMHAAIAENLMQDEDIVVKLHCLDDPEQGLPDEVLNTTDVLFWWGHMAHHEVSDELVAKIRDRVYRGKMGLIVLHSGHHSKVFREVVGTNGNLSWGRDQHDIVWEPFYVPQRVELVFGSWYEDGFIFRSGLCYYRGAGKIFYFQPGHEFCRSFYNPYVQRILKNAVRWAAPNEIVYPIENGCPCLQYKLSDKF